MSNYALTQTIVTGSDPRALPEFSAIREEINKANHPSQPELNWKLVESLALSIFKANGVDLHTATYYTLARTRNQGLAGFCEGSELLAAMITHEWDKFWPQGGPARTEMLDWFNTRTGNILRQQVSFSENDLPLLYRTERALQLICDKLQQVELKRQPRVENLLYFVQNTRKRFEPQPGNRTDTAAQTTVRTLVYAPESTASTISSKRWCIREDYSPCGSPFGPLLKQRYPPWCLRLLPPPLQQRQTRRRVRGVLLRISTGKSKKMLDSVAGKRIMHTPRC